MRMIRSILLVVLTAIVVVFIITNWQYCDTGRCPNVILWPMSNPPLVVTWPVGVIALAFFLAGFIPMWLIARATKWALNRRITTLENSVQAATISPPIATSTQFEAAAAEAAPVSAAPPEATI